MQVTKETFFNLALGALLLQRRITDAENDKSNEAGVLRTWWDIALNKALIDLDLDSTMTPITLELIASDPTDNWGFAYKYPPNCAFFRRIQTSVLCDNRSSHIDKTVNIYQNQKAILTNQDEAIAECIVNDFPFSKLSSPAVLAVSLQLALLASGLITGKGAAGLMKKLQEDYMRAKAEAQAQDRLENFVFRDDETDSEFVQARTE